MIVVTNKNMFVSVFLGEPQWPGVVLVAAGCAASREQSSAHHPGHDITKRPAHRDPQSAHLRHQEASSMTSAFLDYHRPSSSLSLQEPQRHM